MKKCPYCYEQIDDDLTTCPICKRDFSSLPVRPTPMVPVKTMEEELRMPDLASFPGTASCDEQITGNMTDEILRNGIRAIVHRQDQEIKYLKQAVTLLEVFGVLVILYILLNIFSACSLLTGF